MIQTEMPQYNSRRERHDAEAQAKAANHSQPEFGPRRQRRAIERANEYLLNLSTTTEGYKKNQELWPESPILSAVDESGNLLFDIDKAGAPVDITHDLDIHEGIIGAYQARVDNRDWNVIRELDQKWHDLQPIESESEDLFNKYETSDPQRLWKIGQFISRRIFGARQHWLNERTATAKKRFAAPEGEGAPFAPPSDYRKAA